MGFMYWIYFLTYNLCNKSLELFAIKLIKTTVFDERNYNKCFIAQPSGEIGNCDSDFICLEQGKQRSFGNVMPVAYQVMYSDTRNSASDNWSNQGLHLLYYDTLCNYDTYMIG